MVVAARTINSVLIHSMLVSLSLSLSVTHFRILLDYILRPDVPFTGNDEAAETRGMKDEKRGGKER